MEYDNDIGRAASMYIEGTERRSDWSLFVGMVFVFTFCFISFLTYGMLNVN